MGMPVVEFQRAKTCAKSARRGDLARRMGVGRGAVLARHGGGTRARDHDRKQIGVSGWRSETYTYDPFDKRIGVSDDPDGEGQQPAVERWTLYDGANPYADFDGQGNLTHRYLYGPAVDMILGSLSSSDELVWHLADHLGSIRDNVAPTGQVLNHIAYDSFGRVLAETNPTAGDRFKFTAREFDAATGQYYYRARYYDAAIGRFTSEDPLGLAAGDANRYRYVGNCVTGFTDPSGQIVYCPPPKPPWLPHWYPWYTYRPDLADFICPIATVRQLALKRLEGLAPRVQEHLSKIARSPGHPSIGHWVSETQNWLSQMVAEIPKVGKRTGREWTEKIKKWQDDLVKLIESETRGGSP